MQPHRPMAIPGRWSPSTPVPCGRILRGAMRASVSPWKTQVSMPAGALRGPHLALHLQPGREWAVAELRGTAGASSASMVSRREPFSAPQVDNAAACGLWRNASSSRVKAAEG